MTIYVVPICSSGGKQEPGASELPELLGAGGAGLPAGPGVRALPPHQEEAPGAACQDTGQAGCGAPLTAQ